MAEEPIAQRHDRASFDCGEPALNGFLRRYARQSHERGGAKTFVAVDRGDGKTILGYYSLSPASITFTRVPESPRRGLGHYEIGAFRLSRLAVDRRWQGHGLGGRLLLAAGTRCLRVAEDAGGTVLLIDAMSDRAAAWYASFGALPLLDAPRSLVLPLEIIRRVLADRA